MEKYKIRIHTRKPIWEISKIIIKIQVLYSWLRESVGDLRHFWKNIEKKSAYFFAAVHGKEMKWLEH